MGKPIVRLGDKSTGDPCGAGPRGNNQGCSKTFSDGKKIHCKTHSWIPHACPKSPPHGAVTTGGAAKSFAEGLAIARIGDAISCGSTCAEGSPKNTAG